MATMEEELDRFNEFARRQLSSSGAGLSLDELFDL